MRINIIEKFDLYERLENLVTSLSEHEESQLICKNAIHSLKSKFTGNLFNSFVNELSQHKWIESVETFMNELEAFKSENKYGLQLESIMERLDASGVSTYVPVVSKLETMISLSESDIKEKIHELASFKFEPSIRNVISVYEKEAFNKEETPTASIQSAPVSPFMQIDEGFVFSVHGNNFMINNSMTKLQKYEGKTDGMFKAAQNALKTFKYQGNNTFKMNTPKANIKVIAGDVSNRIFINESEITDRKQLTTVLRNTGILSYTDNTTRSMIEFMYENANQIIELEFVKQVKTIHESFDIFKLANNEVLISKYDAVKRHQVLEALDIDGLDELNESLKTKYSLDLDTLVEGLSINKDCMAFEKSVAIIEVSDILDMTKVDSTYSQLDEAYATYESFDIENRKNVEKAFTDLEAKKQILKVDKVEFIVETRNALIEKLDEGEELNESMDLLNTELKSLLG